MEQSDKQLAVERLKNATNVLISVSTNPTVDDLSATIGFSLLLGKLGKHATAVFSGAVPPAIQFLQPEKRLDSDVGGLRDFIIALDKDKADKLRYKVEDNVVKIFITPYRTRITQNDLTFSEGDINVDVVVALGVSNREELDNALKSHGRILHDAAVVTINAGSKSSNLGTINWQDPSASSLCEMLVSISESFGSGLLDEQIATAFLTGIVASTERFSNNRTTPKVMTMAAQLMAAGANQQLIASNLAPAPSSSLMNQMTTPPSQPVQEQGVVSIDHSGLVPTNVDSAPPSPLMPQVSTAPTIAVPQQISVPQAFPQTPPALPDALPIDIFAGLPTSPPAVSQPPTKSLTDLEAEIADLAKSGKNSQQFGPQQVIPPRIEPIPGHTIIPESVNLPSPAQNEPAVQDGITRGFISHAKGHGPTEVDESPSLGGTFNATTEQAHDEAVSDMRKSVNKKLLSHPGTRLDERDEPDAQPPMLRAKAISPISAEPNQPNAFNAPSAGVVMPSSTVPYVPMPPPASSEPPVAVYEAPKPPALAPPVDEVSTARQAVDQAYMNQHFSPENQPISSINAQPLGEVPHNQPMMPPPVANDPRQTYQLPGV